jgi:hypothetical protein
VAILNSDFPAPRASICCYLLEVVISETRSKTGRLLQKNIKNGLKMTKIEKISTCTCKKMLTRRESMTTK